MNVLYQVFLNVFYGLLAVLALFKPKLRKWRKGQQILKSVTFEQGDWTWFHVASYGEYEQAHPLIQAYKNKFPQHKILLTYFSSSALQLKLDKNLIDQHCFLPFDFMRNMERFIKKLKPQSVFVVKYEFWFNWINLLAQHQIPVYFFSCTFHSKQYFFSWYGAWFRKQLLKINQIFLQDKESEHLLKNYGFHQISCVGDTRVDKVINNAQNALQDPLLSEYSKQKKTIVLGSMWKADWLVIKEDLLAMSSYQFIIAPHEVDAANIDYFKRESGGMLYSELKAIPQERFLILDTMGMLKSTYQYAVAGYIGGGFGAGIHNTLEAAVFGIPVVFGPKHQKFIEAHQFIQRGSALAVHKSNQFQKALEQLLQNPQKIQAQNKSYFEQQKGASAKIIEEIYSNDNEC